MKVASKPPASLCAAPRGGRSFLKLTSFSQTLVLRLVGWLGAPAFSQSRARWIRRWSYVPLDVRKWHVVIAMAMTASLVNSLVRRWQESCDERLRQIRAIQARMAAASSYSEWREFAQQLDAMGHCRGGDVSGKIRENLYDRKLLQQKLAHLQSVREHGNGRDMMFALRTDLIRNIANVAKSQLHEHYYELPAPIRGYIQEVKAQLAQLTEWPEAGIDVEEKLSFFKETRHAYGRTALLLSGGGGLGSFHLGVVKALFEHTMLPRVLAGSSVGSIVAGIVGTRTDDELRETFRKLDEVELSFFNNSRALELVHSFLQKGALHDMSYLQRKLKALIGNYTFLEAYERTGRILNVSVCPADTNEPARLLNYLTAPQALIWSAVAASSAFPGLFHPQDLLARNARGEEVRFNAPSLSDNVSRRWRDGSLELDLPTFLLSEMFNCNHFIVSQTNPHIAPLLNLKKSLSRRWANLLELELRHRCAQMQCILPDWFPTKWLTLFTQPWEGDITVVLPSHLWNLGKTMVNPTTLDILAATKQGELAIWEKLSAIETNCTIEATLDACLARLTNKARERPLTGLTSRIPSWLSMPAVGQQAVASWGNPLDAGASPGGRLWHRSKSSQALLNGSSGHLPALLQAQQQAKQQQGSAGTSPSAVGPGGAWYFAGGNAALSASALLGSAGVGGAVHKGDAVAAAAAAAGSAAAEAEGLDFIAP
ncbi:hypothetical protein OEZ86_012199 [Tetradesmus obliquus]|nr:hypothetical protein OEZ86_012199 [Tetradesmus obliquus]